MWLPLQNMVALLHISTDSAPQGPEVDLAKGKLTSRDAPTSSLTPLGLLNVNSESREVARSLSDLIGTVRGRHVTMFLSSLVSKAQQLTGIDPTTLPGPLSKLGNSNSTPGQPSKSDLFQTQFRLPETQHPLFEITAELTLPPPKNGSASANSSRAKSWDKSNWDRDSRGVHYAGQLHLSEQFLCFSTVHTSFAPNASTSASTAYTGRTFGTGPAGNGFTLPLCAVRRVERLHTQSYMFALSITTWNGFDPGTEAKPGAPGPPKLTIQLEGSRHQCERFCDGLKKGLRQGIREVDNMRAVARECYSEHFMQTDFDTVVTADSKSPPDTGLGSIFKYPGNARKLRDRSKMRLWHTYLAENGRNTTLVRQPDFHRLIRVGLPNLLRGEIWELTSGAFFLRLQKPKLYRETLAKHEGEASLAIEEIEKDLNRSLPEYAGFQSEEGIGRLRRVLTAYSWTNTDVGYCQAMNIVVAALLMYVSRTQSRLPAILSPFLTRSPFVYMLYIKGLKLSTVHVSYLSEAQAFYTLSTLCDTLLPGYYSQTMHGTLLDQRVFESLVASTIPILHAHLQTHDIQLSVASLPWFLSLYINSMPLIFAFRVLDTFFLEGPKVLFQIGLAILRVNGEELLDATDDGAFINILKSYFARLGESAHPTSTNPKHRAITHFQALMVVAFKEFDGITMSLVSEQRAKHKAGVMTGIEAFAKRTSIRNLGPESKRLSPNDLGFLYDRFYAILYERQARVVGREREKKGTVGRVALAAPSATVMDFDAFRELIGGITRWAVGDASSSSNAPAPAAHDFLHRLFERWDTASLGTLSLQHVVAGLAGIKGERDIMGSIAYFFAMYDDDEDGKVDREGILRMSEGLLFLGGEEGGEDWLGAVAGFMRRCFEYADPDRKEEGEEKAGALAEEVDLLDLSDEKAPVPVPDEDDGFDPLLHLPPPPSTIDEHPFSSPTAASFSKNKSIHATANAALDPAAPVYITLPTFRMLVLADETLEAFFDAGFANSFVLADGPVAGSTVTSPAFLGLGAAAPENRVSGLPARGGVVGLRGVLDNIVTNGMDVAAEVRKRMDEAQRELDAGGSTRGTEAEEEEDDEEDPEVEGLAADLLEGAEADAGAKSGSASASLLDQEVCGEGVDRGSIRSGMSGVEKDTMFER